MKLSNLHEVRRSGTSPLNWKFTAQVDVTTGMLWWKKTQTRFIAKDYAGFWFFTDTGAFCPGVQAERLFRAVEFANGW